MFYGSVFLMVGVQNQKILYAYFEVTLIQISSSHRSKLFKLQKNRRDICHIACEGEVLNVSD